MTYAVFNGSYISKNNTGIGVVSKDLIKFLSPEIFTSLVPSDVGINSKLLIPNDLSPSHGLKGHLKRLLWLQNNVPEIMTKLGSEFFLSPLPEAPLLKGIRSVVLAHDLIPLRYPSVSLLTSFYLTYVPFVLYQAELILCNSNATAKEIHKFYGVPKRKLFTIKLGYDKSQFYPLRIKRENFFLILGRHNPHKNLDRLIYAFSNLKDTNYKLMFVGPFDRRYTPRLIKLTEKLGISNLCIWKGWVSDHEKALLLNRCTALIIVSLWEGFGLPALEAMACGTLVLASNRGALPELLGDLGFFINPFSIKSIYSGLMEIISDTFTLNKAFTHGPKQASFFDWETTANDIEDIIINKLSDT